MAKQEEQTKTIDYDSNRVLFLSGRYHAMLSILPFVVLAIIVFFLVAFGFVLVIIKDPMESFKIVLMPFMMGMVVMTPLAMIFMFMIRWHGKRRIEMDEEGITMVLPGERSVYVPWEYLVAVEMRFTKPRLVNITLVSAALRFSFSTVEINLEGRKPLKQVFQSGFELDKIREVLYYLHRKAPHLSWRMSQNFKEQFNIFYPPYDLEKLK